MAGVRKSCCKKIGFAKFASFKLLISLNRQSATLPNFNAKAI